LGLNTLGAAISAK